MLPTKRKGLPGDPDTLRGITTGGAGGVDTDGLPAHTSPRLDPNMLTGQSATAGPAVAIDDPRPTKTTHPPRRSCRFIV